MNLLLIISLDILIYLVADQFILVYVFALTIYLSFP